MAKADQSAGEKRSLRPFIFLLIAGIAWFVVTQVVAEKYEADAIGYGAAVATVLSPILVIWAIAGLVIRARHNHRMSRPEPTVRAQSAVPRPVGWTQDGKAIYPVVGYTSEGQVITADNAVGLRPLTPGMNSLAITALVLGLVAPILAIPFGHVARSQIRRTGEQGSGMALAGLILGYIGLVVAFFGVIFVILASNLS